MSSVSSMVTLREVPPSGVNVNVVTGIVKSASSEAVPPPSTSTSIVALRPGGKSMLSGTVKLPAPSETEAV